MSKSLFIAEKPSVAQEFANALKKNWRRRDGFLEAEDSIVTWCVGHLVTMSYPEAYDPKYRRWSLETLPFLPKEFKYQVIDGVAKQFQIVSGLLNREDVETIYICTDSGREGEYIYRLVDQMAGVKGKVRKRVSASAYLRAKEDYLMGINFSRLLTLKYGNTISNYLRQDRTVLSVGRVMTCVLGMVVRREREVREFVKTPFYRVIGTFGREERQFDGEWKAVAGSRYFETPFLYKENGFKEKKTAEELIHDLTEGEPSPWKAVIASVERKKETKNPPLLYNLAELQNDCSRMFKISPDETLRVVQELYERKLVTYPRTDARVLSTAVAKEIHKNIGGLRQFEAVGKFAAEILEQGSYQGISKTRYVNDKQITDHYAIIPTGQGFGALHGLPPLSLKVYEVIARRFLSIFYPAAVYQKTSLDVERKGEHFFAGFRILSEPGYLKVADVSFGRKRDQGERKERPEEAGKDEDGSGDESETNKKDLEDPEFLRMLSGLKKGMEVTLSRLTMKEGETSPPKRYTSGSMILAMENAGQLIEDEELRAQIKGSGIGTSATRAEILKKDQGKRYRYQRHQSRDPKKAGQY